MSTKIKRCLYIGLGGTGMKALLHTKKMFIDTYGEVPPMIGFLGIDTDGGEYNKSILAANGDPITILKNEQLPIHVQDARPIYERSKAYFSWIPEKNIYSLQSMMLGAGQVRTNGRFAFTVNKSDVESAILAKLNAIQNAQIIDNSKYSLLDTAEPEIHMVFSICGGTGSGTFLSVAYLLRQIAGTSKINGYAVLPDVFKTMSSSGMAKVAPNAYGALVDLDFLMQRGMGDTPIKLDYLNGDQYEIKGRPFNSMVFIDNKNKDGHTYTDVNQLTEMISLALITASGELSIAGASVGDNLEKNISEGSMNIENKVAWAGGMGACEIVYNGDILSKIYQYKAGINIINRMFNACDDANTIANTWIDSAEVHIRENNGQDHVTEYFWKDKLYPLTISAYKDPRPEVVANININKIDDKEIVAKQEELIERVRKQLRILLVKYINRECGISSAKNIVEEIKIQMGICLGEMHDEKIELEKRIPELNAKIDSAIEDLKSYAGRLISTSSKKEQYASEVSEAVRQLNVNAYDIQRHNAAINVYNSIIVMLDECDERLGNIEKTLMAVKQNLMTEVAKMQNGVTGDGSSFQINLAEEDAKNLSVKSEDILITEFIDSLSGDNKFYGFNEYSAKEIEEFILSYTKNLAAANKYKNKSVEDVLQQILNGENGKSDFDRIITRSISKAMPLFRYDHDGYFPTENPSDIFYVGVHNAKDNILAEDDRFKNLITGGNPNVQFASIGMKNKVVIYRQVGVVPAYAIVGVKNFETEYKRCTGCVCHFDANILRRMEREEFEIWPKPINNNDMLDLWVKGLIYGLIKNEGKCYYMKSESLGDALDDYWVKLAEWRDEAYDEFKRHELHVSKDFNAYIASENERVGAEATRALMEKAKAGYYDEYSQIKIQKPTLKQKGYEKVAELIRLELAHLKNIK